MNKRLVAGLSSVLTLACTISACSSSDAGKGKDGAAAASPGASAKQQAPLAISIMSKFYTAEPPGPDNVIVKELEKRTNTKLDITWVSPNNYDDKVNVTMAGGDMPELLLVSDPFAPQVRSMAEQGAFWNLTPYLKDYKNLMSFPEDTWNNTKMADGGNYGIPRVRPVEGGSNVHFRKDWLDKLNLKLPETIDDVYKVWKAFAQNDPDGNGKNDTYGFAGAVNVGSLGAFAWIENVFTGNNGPWKVQDGKLINVNLEKDIRDALVWMANLYKEKIIPEEFAVMKESQANDLIFAGRVGSSMDTVEGTWEDITEVRKVKPDADFAIAPSIAGPYGPYIARDSGYFGMFVIPKKVPENKMKQLLAFMDYGASEEGSDLANYGLKGVHYNEENGVKVATDQAIKDIVGQQAMGQILLKYDKYLRAYRTGMPANVFQQYKKVIDDSAKVSKPNPSVGLFSETYVKLGSEYNKKWNDLKIKVIMGSEPIASWDSYVTQLKTDKDFQKMTSEMNDAYQKRMKK
ncbi:type 2 periplasmic-binding domain-containing protein [Paenibacillus cymbidii]|uniref:extracellular solute-binding protein n=1 Tax=Paenibacillus cymbidii TaxID=1639034 RepID=UPI00108054B0|nr:extracellular solute-binding protein [Paenibacillus cymbidii]